MELTGRMTMLSGSFLCFVVYFPPVADVQCENDKPGVLDLAE